VKRYDERVEVKGMGEIERFGGDFGKMCFFR
jgi:hypothetical protein